MIITYPTSAWEIRIDNNEIHLAYRGVHNPWYRKRGFYSIGLIVDKKCFLNLRVAPHIGRTLGLKFLSYISKQRDTVCCMSLLEGDAHSHYSFSGFKNRFKEYKLLFEWK